LISTHLLLGHTVLPPRPTAVTAALLNLRAGIVQNWKLVAAASVGRDPSAIVLLAFRTPLPFSVRG